MTTKRKIKTVTVPVYLVPAALWDTIKVIELLKAGITIKNAASLIGVSDRQIFRILSSLKGVGFIIIKKHQPGSKQKIYKSSHKPR